jgi:hypothetical protein
VGHLRNFSFLFLSLLFLFPSLSYSGECNDRLKITYSVLKLLDQTRQVSLFYKSAELPYRVNLDEDGAFYLSLHLNSRALMSQEGALIKILNKIGGEAKKNETLSYSVTTTVLADGTKLNILKLNNFMEMFNNLLLVSKSGESSDTFGVYRDTLYMTWISTLMVKKFNESLGYVARRKGASTPFDVGAKVIMEPVLWSYPKNISYSIKEKIYNFLTSRGGRGDLAELKDLYEFEVSSIEGVGLVTMEGIVESLSLRGYYLKTTIDNGNHSINTLTFQKATNINEKTALTIMRTFNVQTVNDFAELNYYEVRKRLGKALGNHSNTIEVLMIIRNVLLKSGLDFKDKAMAARNLIVDYPKMSGGAFTSSDVKELHKKSIFTTYDLSRVYPLDRLIEYLGVQNKKEKLAYVRKLGKEMKIEFPKDKTQIRKDVRRSLRDSESLDELLVSHVEVLDFPQDILGVLERYKVKTIGDLVKSIDEIKAELTEAQQKVVEQRLEDINFHKIAEDHKNKLLNEFAKSKENNDPYEKYFTSDDIGENFPASQSFTIRRELAKKYPKAKLLKLNIVVLDIDDELKGILRVNSVKTIEDLYNFVTKGTLESAAGDHDSMGKIFLQGIEKKKRQMSAIDDDSFDELIESLEELRIIEI